MKMAERRALIAQIDVWEFFKNHVDNLLSPSAKGKCPFCDVAQLTLRVDLPTGQWICFACGEKGQLFELLIRKYHINAEQAGMLVKAFAEHQEAKTQNSSLFEGDFKESNSGNDRAGRDF